MISQLPLFTKIVLQHVSLFFSRISSYFLLFPSFSTFPHYYSTLFQGYSVLKSFMRHAPPIKIKLQMNKMILVARSIFLETFDEKRGFWFESITASQLLGLTSAVKDMFHRIVPNPKKTRLIAVHMLLMLEKCDQIRFKEGMRATVMHETGRIKEKMTKVMREKLMQMANCEMKKMIEHSWMVLMVPSCSQILLESTKMMLSGMTTEIKMIELALASIVGFCS